MPVVAKAEQVGATGWSWEAMKENEEKLTLPNPARELWLQIREAVRESLAEIVQSGTERTGE